MATIVQNNGSGPVVVGTGIFDELVDPTHDHSDYAQGGPVQGFAETGSVMVDFGFPNGGEDSIATATVAAPWVTADTLLMCSVPGVTTPDHDPEDPAVEFMNARATNIVPGVSFDVEVSAPNGTWGRYMVTIRG